MNRRGFLQASTGAVALLSLGRPARAFGACTFVVQSPPLRKFVTQLRGVGGPGGIPLAVPDAAPAPVTGVLHYTIEIEQFKDRLHPDLHKTTLWGFNPVEALGVGPDPRPRHLGGIFVVQKGTPIQITFRNKLPPEHILPVDTTIPGAELARNRTAVHNHGGFVPWISDGGPFAWWTPDGETGESFLNNQVLNPWAAPDEAEYYYPNDQSARMLWYHDHALGITRLNAYAGIASAYILRDEFEAGLRALGLPDFIENGGFELPIIIQDKTFVDPRNIQHSDPTWPGPRTPGSLWYPHVYDPALYELEPGAPPPPDPSVVPEFFADTMLANGTVYPEATVEARRYRLRILNACNARFLNLQLYVEDPQSPDGIKLVHSNCSFVPTNDPGPDFLQIGTEGGLLPHPVVVPSDVPFDPETGAASLLLAPAERADVIIDFSGFETKNLILYNDAPAPFPDGNPIHDYFPGAPENPVETTPGFGPNTRQIMRFSVVPATSVDPPLLIDTSTDLTDGNAPLLVTGNVLPPIDCVRRLTLNEDFDEYGRLIQLLGTADDGPLPYMATATETPQAGTTEIWEIENLTGDTHPIHFHLVNVQILSRQAPNEAARPPEPNEAGWKDTVRMNPGEITRVIMRFDLPTVPFTVPASPRTGGFEYVWHCHILEHEEHDMMRPLIVLP